MTLDYQRQNDNENTSHLNLLSIFHFVAAGLAALFSCFFLFYIAMCVMMLNDPSIMRFPTSAPVAPPPAIFGWMFIAIGSGLTLIGWTLAGTMLVAGVKLRRRRSRMFCIVVAAVECIFFPFGTILGVFTIIVLSRDSVKILYSR